jgi:NADPH:quinone reductase-like Zn-dependent oxidoreductase
MAESKQMKASIYREYGPPEVLNVEEVPSPEPKRGEILIKVKAATVNRTDCAMLRAKPFIMRFLTGLIKPKNPILGTDFAGIVEDIGIDISTVKKGDLVFGFDDSGLSSHAQYMAIDEKKACVIPDGISFELATSSLEGAHYAINFINKIKIQTGEAILVNGATGAIGSAAVQLIKYYGGQVTAVCRKKDFDKVKAMGADELIDYQTEDFTKLKRKFKFVFDTVGKSSFSKCKPILEKDGIYISSELGWMAQNLFYALFTPIFSKKKVIFPIPVDIGTSVQLISKLLENGMFKPMIDRTYSLRDIAEAYKYVESGQKVGNVVIVMGY